MTDTYEMTIGLNVLEHLGINLYSNVAAVLTEVVANAWDADATVVNIEIDSDEKRISITDDGVGMTIPHMNNRYLKVGYRRREDEYPHATVTAKRRPVMGRKGLGKLSLFSIANQIEIRTAHQGAVHGCRMSTADIRIAAESNKPYFPQPIPLEDLGIRRGTQITLKDIRRDRLATSTTALRKRLARRFAIIGESDQFRVTVNDEPITLADRDDLSNTQFLWTLGDSRLDEASTNHVQRITQLPTRDETWEEGWEVRGWIGTAHKPKDLDIKDIGNLNSIVVLARGRLFHENILEKLNDGRFYTKYLTGQLEVEFLDLDSADDIATSDRQRIQEHDERYTALVSFLRSTLARIESKWSEWRPAEEAEKAKQERPALVDWLDTLGSGHRPSAELLIGKIRSLPLDDENERAELFRHGVLAFERLKLVGATSELAEHLYSPAILLRILADRDSLEASLYLDIIRSRLNALEAIQMLVDDNAKERVLQEYLFEHLWLLDPAWERATGSPRMEETLRKKGIFGSHKDQRETLGRVDIRYRTTSGKHIIIELKRAGRQMKLEELEQQGRKYVDALNDILRDPSDPNPNIEVVFVLGKPLPEETSNPDRLRSSMDSISRGSRITHYDVLIHKAGQIYQEYLGRNAHLDTVNRIVQHI